MPDQTSNVWLCNETVNYGILPVFPEASWDRFTYPETKKRKKNGFRRSTDVLRDSILGELEPSRSWFDAFSFQ